MSKAWFSPGGNLRSFRCCRRYCRADGTRRQKDNLGAGNSRKFFLRYSGRLHHSAWQKPLQAGHPAMMGVLAASLAEKNLIGARSMYDGTNSIIRSLSYRDQYDLGRLTVNLGKKWEIMDTSIKVGGPRNPLFSQIPPTVLMMRSETSREGFY